MKILLENVTIETNVSSKGNKFTAVYYNASNGVKVLLGFIDKGKQFDLVKCGALSLEDFK